MKMTIERCTEFCRQAFAQTIQNGEPDIKALKKIDPSTPTLCTIALKEGLLEKVADTGTKFGARRWRGESLPDRSTGAALFADIYIFMYNKN